MEFIFGIIIGAVIGGTITLVLIMGDYYDDYGDEE